MNWEDIVNEELKELIKEFYVYHAAMIWSDLGIVSPPNIPKFPVYFAKYNQAISDIARKLLDFNVEVKKAVLPSREGSSTGDLSHEIQNLLVLKMLLVREDAVIEPPQNLYPLTRNFLNRLPTPWH